MRVSSDYESLIWRRIFSGFFIFVSPFLAVGLAVFVSLYDPAWTWATNAVKDDPFVPYIWSLLAAFSTVALAALAARTVRYGMRVLFWLKRSP